MTSALIMSEGLGFSSLCLELAESRLRFLAPALRSDDTLILWFPAPPGKVERLLSLAPSEPAVFWSCPRTGDLAGVGVTLELLSAGADRFADVQRTAERIFARIHTLGFAGGAEPLPRLFGGFSFHEGCARSALWRRFGDAWFVLPRLVLSASNGRSILGLALRANEIRDPKQRWHHLELARVTLEALAARPLAHRETSAPSAVDVVEHCTRAHWLAAVQSIRQAIDGGFVEKVVAAHRTALKFAAPPMVSRIIERLRAQGDECTLYLLRRDGASFLGATPERLIEKRGREVQSEALAGSMPNRGITAEEVLFQSAKDLREHSIVVREIRAALAPLCNELDLSSKPIVRRLRYVMHLRTPITGRLREPLHVLRLVERLHPTPAVGGVPVATACHWIRTQERQERGWYAAPIGWFDANGDGQFCVALRSGLIEGDHAFLYAGAGIVGDSDPSAEYAETRHKLTAMLSALGAVV